MRKDYNMKEFDSGALKIALQKRGIRNAQAADAISISRQYFSVLLHSGHIGEIARTALREKFGINESEYVYSAMMSKSLSASAFAAIKRAVKEAVAEMREEGVLL